MVQNDEDLREDMDQFNTNVIKMNKDTYCLAFASLIDANQMPKDGDKVKEGFMTEIKYTRQEMSNLYLGALLVIFFQFTVCGLIINEMLFSETFEITLPVKFSIIVPRVLSATLAHLKVEPDIRSGLNLMKYAINHPEKF